MAAAAVMGALAFGRHRCWLKVENGGKHTLINRQKEGTRKSSKQGYRKRDHTGASLVSGSELIISDRDMYPPSSSISATFECAFLLSTSALVGARFVRSFLSSSATPSCTLAPRHSTRILLLSSSATRTSPSITYGLCRSENVSKSTSGESVSLSKNLLALTTSSGATSLRNG
ncbi:hypothetical protein GQ54DRAFT_149791 [Martensiomyces pterosporus]|nr:hypothetical protein GQ54DRAFT_149791 [Martensiomyces pterosporus]